MQTTGWTRKDARQIAGNASGAQTESRHHFGWTLAFAFLTTLAETVFVLAHVPRSMLG